MSQLKTLQRPQQLQDLKFVLRLAPLVLITREISFPKLKFLNYKKTVVCTCLYNQPQLGKGISSKVGVSMMD